MVRFVKSLPESVRSAALPSTRKTQVLGVARVGLRAASAKEILRIEPCPRVIIVKYAFVHVTTVDFLIQILARARAAVACSGVVIRARFRYLSLMLTAKMAELFLP